METLIVGHFLGPDGFEISKLFDEDMLRWCIHTGIFVALVLAWLPSGRNGKMVGAMRGQVEIF